MPTVLSDSSDCQIATINPFRYRGYYYDAEIGMYYLQSRYYNPGIGRFVSSDTLDFLNYNYSPIIGNLYTYCMNSPAIYHDADGMIALEISIGAIGTIICKALLVLVASYLAFKFLDAIIKMFYKKATKQKDFALLLIKVMIYDIIAKIESFTTKAVTSIKQFENDLSALVEAVLQTYSKARQKKKSTSYHLHHIVAQSSARAWLARSVLYANDLDTSNPFNLVWISQRMHSGIHTNGYYAAVNTLFASTYTVKKRERMGYIYALWVSIASFLTAVDISINQ